MGNDRNGGGDNPLKKEILEAVENQIKNRDPEYVKEAFMHLYILTGSEQEAKELIGAVLVEEMHGMMSNAEPFNDSRYHERLNRIFDQFPEDEVEVTGELARHPIARIRWETSLIPEKTDGKLGEYKKRAKQRAEIFWEMWNESAREWVRTRGKNGTVAMEDLGDYSIDYYDIEETFENAELDLLNADMNEERISFLTDLLEFINWEESDIDRRETYKAYIGESMSRLGKYDEADAYFEKLLAEDPGNDEYMLVYVVSHYERGDYEGAKDLMEKSISLETEITDGNSSLFDWADEIYEKLGENDKAEAFRKKLEKWEGSHKNAVSPMNRESAEFLKLNADVMSGLGMEIDLDKTATRIPTWTIQNGQITSMGSKKIYPNDPCPCGSGKKYKKCCGRANAGKES